MTKNSITDNRMVWLDVIRCVAMLMVIGVHCIDPFYISVLVFFHVMSQQQITVESGEVVKHAEFVPCIGTENITAAVEEPVGYIFAYIRNKERDDPDKQDSVRLLPIRMLRRLKWNFISRSVARMCC